ncbi:MAG: PleD family two-component system response regulator [Rhodospirillaceae bacterium]|jgi:two-component system cell cycle response regulator|nr:PleD family two-component system response regulator [Rhodospirillaceae bacterium]MBT3629213.1 PleD family two-component system response regulator [Rhodospirillaceae bacterium]MBT3925682.1 PleD family two-component system response regulator [Rhodospirillaceae bacterium]MBT4427515.1 PleD family two-component system response regulator [Rhodospirillaceae bacterium]MBT5039408.1 PleD family two-component system response regulator [Rhodospirillaceae bacterium]
MSARVLVVDDIPVNVRLLEAKLSAEYYDVITATSGAEALALIKAEPPDIVLLDIMMPEMDGFEVCRRIKADPATALLPVIMVTALNEQSDRVTGLEAGADDFLTKPVRDLALFARLRSLLRVKMLLDELRLREETSRQMNTLRDVEKRDDLLNGQKILFVGDQADEGELIASIFDENSHADMLTDPGEALEKALAEDYDMVFVSLALSAGDPLRLCSHLRSNVSTRHVPILVLVEESEPDQITKALELGVNDYIMQPINFSEARARALTQSSYRRYHDELRGALEKSVDMAFTDGLTGLYNRRYVTRHLASLAQSQGAEDHETALIMVDIDHFKNVNDSYGHDVGDEVLKEISKRLQLIVRGQDLASRLGGEEFLIVVTNATVENAEGVAERIRSDIANEPITASTPSGNVEVTVSVGVAMRHSTTETPDRQLKRADEALYEAKRGGRDRVVMAA